MDEWFKSHAWKACIGVSLSGVRIPLSPPELHRKPRKFKCLRGFLFFSPSGSLSAGMRWAELIVGAGSRLAPRSVARSLQVRRWRSAIACPVSSREKKHRPTGSKCKYASSFRPIHCSNFGTSATRLRRRYVRSPSSRRASSVSLGSGSSEKCRWRYLRIGASAGRSIWAWGCGSILRGHQRLARISVQDFYSS